MWASPPDDTAAVLSSLGITGLAFVDLKAVGRTSGRACRRLGEADEPFPEIRNLSVPARRGVVAADGGQGGRASVEQVAAGVQQFLAGPDTRGTLVQVLRNLERISGTLAADDQAIIEALRRVNAILGDTADATRHLPAVVDHAGTLSMPSKVLPPASKRRSRTSTA